MTSIEWTKITPAMKVVLVGKKGAQHYEAGGKLVTWGSRDAKEAQRYLDQRVHLDSHVFVVGTRRVK